MANFVNDNTWGIIFDCAVDGKFSYCKDYILCSEIKKWDNIKIATENDTVCQYSDESQLFYIVKV